ncbi:lipocalin family protein [Flagellimonas pacifica]|uniref:Lipocalin-like domain-containing protein n=1 Tax=Flagellimonas pacifica TaxID=1247520 RepID=A0A285MYP1_9FLAO|nr:lipocalin family protein [Allomuricauda parva]SNZ00906.1 hypothetical protein SAMN06265377_2734 [Allomuricauda parva]
MRTQILNLSLILLFTVFIGCSNDDDNPIENEILNGTWQLKNVSGGLAGVNVDYGAGEVTWTFKPSDNVLVVTNLIDSTGPEDIYAGLDTGTYNYKVQEIGQTKLLFIEENKWGAIILSNKNLKIDEGVPADGLLRAFTR